VVWQVREEFKRPENRPQNKQNLNERPNMKTKQIITLLAVALLKLGAGNAQTVPATAASQMSAGSAKA